MGELLTPEDTERVMRILVMRIMDGAEKGVIWGANMWVDEAKKIAPVGTPETTGIPTYIVSEAYKRSLRRRPFKWVSSVAQSGVRAGGYITNPNTGRKVDYALILEVGHSKQAPTGILLQSGVSSREKILNRMAGRIKNQIFRGNIEI
jgi:hypothetical protein